MAHAWKHLREKPKGGTAKVLLRLFHAFARPYWPILVVAALSALLVGGAHRRDMERFHSAHERTARGGHPRARGGFRLAAGHFGRGFDLPHP